MKDMDVQREDPNSRLIIPPINSNINADRTTVITGDITRSRDSTPEPEYLAPSALSPHRVVGAKSSVFSLVATIVGGGCLSLPYALSKAGLIPGTFCIFLFSLFSDFSVDLLLTCSRRTGATSYQQIAVLCFGRKGKYITMMLIFIMIWLACAAYAVLMADLFGPVINFLFNVAQNSKNRIITIICAVGVISPACYARKLGALRNTSMFSLFSIFILSLALAWNTSKEFNEDHEIYVYVDHTTRPREMIAHIQWWPESLSALLTVSPVFCVAYVCHFNVLPVQKELRRPTRGRIRAIIHSTMALCALLYAAIAILGYFWSMEETCGNILLNFATDDVPMTIGRCALGLTVMLTFPLLVLPARDTLHNMLGMTFPDFFLPAPILDDVEHSIVAQRGTPNSSAADFLSRSVSLYGSPMRKGGRDIVSSASRNEEDNRIRGDSPHGQQGPDWHNSLIPASQDPEFENTLSFEASHTALIIETTSILVSSVVLACFIPGIMVLWSLMGATVCMIIAFVMPCVFWIKLRWNADIEPSLYSSFRKPFVVFLLMFSCIGCVLFTFEAVQALKTPACPKK